MYGTIEDWRAYAALRGDTTPAVASDEVASASLQRASDYIRTRYVLRSRAKGTEPEVIEATYIAASIDLATPGFWQKTFTPSELKVLTAVDGIRWTPIESGMGGTDSVLPTSPMIDSLLIRYESFGTGFMAI